MQQKIVVIDPEKHLARSLEYAKLAKLCEERGKEDPSDEEMERLTERIMNQIIEQENAAGFRVSFIATDMSYAPLRLLCTPTTLKTSQRLKLIRLWQENELFAFSYENCNGIADLRLTGALTNLNAAGYSVDSMSLGEKGYLGVIVTEA